MNQAPKNEKSARARNAGEGGVAGGAGPGPGAIWAPGRGRGCIRMQYADGCVVEFTAPQAVVIDPGHDGWVVGDEPAVLIEFDFMSDTARRFGLPEAHSHD